VINFSAGVTSAVVVVIFVVVKFTEGAWLVVILFAAGVPALIRLNREYQMEAGVLARIGTRAKPPEPPTYSRRTVFVFVDSFDLATIAALRYARSLRPTTLRAVHFVIDSARADLLRDQWTAADRGVVLDFIDVPDRRLVKAASDLVSHEVEVPGTHVTVILPRRSYSPLLGRLLHDRTADKIAAAVSRIPRSAATIIPFDVQSRLELLQERQAARAAGQDAGGQRPAGAAGPNGAAGPAGPAGSDGAARSAGPARSGGAARPAASRSSADEYGRPVPSPGVDLIASLTGPGRATVEGRVRSVEIRPAGQSSVLACTVADSTGELTALFYGRQHIAGVEPGTKIRLNGAFGIRDGQPAMINPNYVLLRGT
jgi:hypothetical protein